MAEVLLRRGELDPVIEGDLYPVVCAAVTQGLIEYVKLGKGNLVELPLAGGASYAANPGFVMSVQALTATTTEIVVAGKGKLTINDAFVDVIDKLTEFQTNSLATTWPTGEEEQIKEIASRLAAAAVQERADDHAGIGNGS